MDRCLPFDTQFSPYQAFLSAITPVPAGTYNVSMGFNWGTNVKSGKTYQFTLTHDLPAGGQLAGFYGAPDQAPGNWRVYAFSGPSVTTPTETCVVTEGSAGTSLGTFTAVGVSVPASGTPAETTVGSLRFYGLNSLHRVAYGNNRWLHSPLRQYLNAQDTGWWSPATVFDRPPAYAAYDGFLTGFSDDFLAAMQPIAQVTALNYVTDGGTSAEPAYDTTYDRVFLPSGKQHHLQPTAAYGGSAGLEGDSWEYWMRVAGTQTPLPWSTWGNEATYHPEYIQYDLAAPTTARTCFMRSANRGNGNNVTYVNATGNCNNNNATNGYRAAADRAWNERIRRPTRSDGRSDIQWHKEPASRGVHPQTEQGRRAVRPAGHMPYHRRGRHRIRRALGVHDAIKGRSDVEGQCRIFLP
jgi:hypothetical protein